LKLIYYTTAFYASHGGSSHSKHFFKEAAANPLVHQVLLFPEKNSVGGSVKPSGRFRSWIRKISLMQVYFFYRRNKFHLDKLLNFIGKEKPDAIIIRLDSNFLQLRALREKFPRLIIATEINASPFNESFKNIFLRPVFRRMERRYLAEATCNFFVSNALRLSIMGESIRKDRDFVVHNGVDIEAFKVLANRMTLRASYRLGEDELILGYIGTLDAHKKMDILLKSFQKVSNTFDHARLLIIGDGSEKGKLEQLANHLQIQNKVTFTGWQSHGEIPNYLNCFDIAIHHYAGDYMSPIKIFEYLACGAPVIGPDSSAVREVFKDGVHLRLTDGSVEDLANKIIDLLQHPDKRSALGLAGKELVEENYTWRKNADFILSQMNNKLESR
jgi:glycosyltransferase involved in cell wall biosynthesis